MFELVEQPPEKSNKLKSRKDPEREQRFIENLFLYQDHIEAARQAGYSESTAKNIKALKLNNPLFIDRLKKSYTARKVNHLIHIHAIETAALEEYAKEPDKAIKYPALLKDIRKAAGIDQDDGPKQTIINIKGIRELNIQLGAADKESTQEAEIINNA